MKRQRLRATPGGYFKQLCLYLQNDETFDHCSRNNRVSEFRGHVVLVNDTKSAGQLQNDAKAEHPTGGVQCAKEFEVENREGAPFNRRTLVWHGWLQLQVESRTWRWRWRLPVPRTGIKQKKKKKYPRLPAKTASSHFTVLNDNQELKLNSSLNCGTSKKNKTKLTAASKRAFQNESP